MATINKSPFCHRAFWVHWFVLVLRVVLVFIPIQSTGVLHVVPDIIVMLVGEKVHEGKSTCRYEEQGEHCPPGCSDCHCLSAPALLNSFPSVVLVSIEVVPAQTPVHYALAPPRPILSGIERPPRHA